MAKKNNNVALITIIAVIGIGLFIFFPNILQQQAVLTPTKLSITQYAGNPDLFHSQNWIWMEDFSLDFSDTAIIGDYKIEIKKDWRGTKYGESYCASNTCNGKPVEINEDGCQIWEGTETKKVGGGKCREKYSTGGNCCSGDIEVGGDILDAWVSGGKNKKDDNCAIKEGIVDWKMCVAWGANHPGGRVEGNVECSATIKKTCGGLIRDKKREGKGECWSKATIYYNKPTVGWVKIDEVDVLDWDNRRRSASFKDGKKVSHTESELRIDVHTDSDYTGAQCNMIVNEFIFRVLSDDFEADITSAEEKIKGELVEITISITNNFKPTKANLVVNFEVPTSIGSATSTQEEIITLPLGKSDYIFEIATDQVTDKINVDSHIDFLIEGSEFQGANHICYKQEGSEQQSLQNCEYVKIGEIKEENFVINMREIITIEKFNLLLGELNKSEEIRDELKFEIEAIKEQLLLAENDPILLKKIEDLEFKLKIIESELEQTKQEIQKEIPIAIQKEIVEKKEVPRIVEVEKIVTKFPAIEDIPIVVWIILGVFIFVIIFLRR